MKIAISVTEQTLEADVDPRFGRCQHFIIFDLISGKFEFLDNKSADFTGGAGIATAQMIADSGVQVVLTGNCGPNAYRVLSVAGIQVVTGVAGKAKDAVDKYERGDYPVAGKPNVANHYGSGFRSPR